jgi:hypothetical protein
VRLFHVIFLFVMHLQQFSIVLKRHELLLTMFQIHLIHVYSGIFWYILIYIFLWFLMYVDECPSIYIYTHYCSICFSIFWLLEGTANQAQEGKLGKSQWTQRDICSLQLCDARMQTTSAKDEKAKHLIRICQNMSAFIATLCNVCRDFLPVGRLIFAQIWHDAVLFLPFACSSPGWIRTLPRLSMQRLWETWMRTKAGTHRQKGTLDFWVPQANGQEKAASSAACSSRRPAALCSNPLNVLHVLLCSAQPCIRPVALLCSSSLCCQVVVN